MKIETWVQIVCKTVERSEGAGTERKRTHLPKVTELSSAETPGMLTGLST